MGDLRGVDVETPASDDGTCQPLVVLSVDGVLTHRRDVTRRTVEELFARPLVGAGVVTELAVLSRQAGTVGPAFEALARGDVYDVLTRQKYLDIAAGRKRPKVSLEVVAPLHGQRKLAEAGDVWRLRYGELYDVPLPLWPQAAVDYASEDSRILVPIFEGQEAAGPEGVFVDQHRRACGHWALHLSSLFGMPVDQAAVDVFARGLEEMWEAERQKMVAAGFMRPNGSRNKIAALAHAASVGATAKAPSGKGLSLKKQACLDNGDPDLVAWAEFEHLGKLKSTFVKMLRRSSRLRPRYDELLSTARVSASKPNIQQLPRAPGIRECCVPDPGHCLISCDVDKAELCALGDLELEILGKSKLAEAINASPSIDPHCLLGAELLQLSFPEFMRRYEAGDAECIDARQDVKPANFGLPVGMSAEKYVAYARGQGRELSLKRAREVVAAWRRAWPTTVAYQRAVQALLRRTKGFVKHPRSGLLRGGLRFTQAANGFFQERVASAMLEAIWVLACLQWGRADLVEGFDAEHFAPLVGTRTVAFIHDEVIVQCRIDAASQVATLVREVVERVVQKWIPRVRITAGTVAMLRWSKKAKPTFDAEGRLIPWAPKAP